MLIISIDLELNQPTRSIISIGYVIAHARNKQVKVAKNLIVNPNEMVDPFITGLTGLTQNDINNGIPLIEAYNQMVKDINHHQVNKHPIQWGLDHNELKDQVMLGWNEFVFRRRGHDIKSLYQLYQTSSSNGKTIAGLRKAMGQLNIDWDFAHGPPHNSLADAYNTLLIFWKITDKFKRNDQIEKIFSNS